MKVKFYNRKMEFIAIKDCESVSYTRQKNKEYSISFTPIVNERYDFSDVYFFSLLDDNSDKDKRLTFLPCGVLTNVDINNKCSGNSIEHYLQNISVLPENWGWWNNKTLKSVLQDHIYGFRTYRKASFTELSDAVYSHHVEVATLENGNGEVYAGTADYRNVPTSELYYYSDGYIIYRMQVPEEARRSGMVLRWADVTGGNTDITVQFKWSETGNDYTGTYSTEQSPVRGEDIKPNETAGVDIPESSMGYLFIRFNLKYNTGTISEAHLRGINYDNEVTSVEEGTSTVLYYGTTAILNAFEVVYRVETHFSLGDFVLSDTKLNQADISECTNLLESLKAISEAYNISFFCTLSGGTIALNCYDAYVNDTTNDFVVSDVINASVQEKDTAIDVLQAVEAFGAGTGLDRVHTFVKLNDSEEDITNIGTFEDSDIYNESDLITAAKEYISTQNEGLSSATFEYYSNPISMYDKVKAVIKGKVYNSTITEEKISIDGESTKKSYTIGIKEYPFRTLYSNPFGGTYLTKPAAPSNFTTKRTYDGWAINWKGTTNRYIFLYRVSGESIWNSLVADNSSVIISNIEYNKTYEFKVYAVSTNNVLSDATEIQYSNSGDETGFQTASIILYKRASSEPSKPSNSLVYTFVDSSITGDKDGWSDEFVDNDGNALYVTKYTAVSKESSVTIASADWSTPVLLVDNGSDGEAGYRTTSIELFQWASSAPTSFPSGSSDFSWVDGTFTLPITLNGWSLTGGTASEGQNLYRVRQVYTDNGTSLTSTITWSATSSISVGTVGENGTRRAVLELYKWAADTPTSFPSGTSTYTWETGSFTMPSTLNGWSVNAGNGNEGESLYYCFMVYSDKDTSETSSVSWSTSTAYKTGYNGISGDTGKSVYVGSIYKQSSSAPATPTGGSYDFETSVLTPPSGWSITQPATTTTPTYIAEFRFVGDTPDAVVTATTWTTPVIDAVAGADGDDGYSQDRVYVYYQGSTVPTAPTGGAYKLSDGTLVVPTGGGTGVTWSGTQPASSTSPTYKTSALFRSNTPTVAVAPTGTWSTPIVTAQNGSNGSDATAQVITSPSSTTPNATMVYPNIYYGIYAGAWYKWAWTNTTTGFWTYTDVTPITDSWANYNGLEIPELPDNVAGATYLQTEWATVDGWFNDSGMTVSVEDGKLKVVSTVSAACFVYKGSASYQNKSVIAKIKGSVPIQTISYKSAATTWVSVPITKINDYECLVSFVFSRSDNNNLVIYFNIADGILNKTMWIDSIYIGTGAYDTLVFDNSYHHRHLINNAVIPTPQGLYFNGTTSYLRSRDVITLPDVFTFRATVNLQRNNGNHILFSIKGFSATVPHIVCYVSEVNGNLAFAYTNGTSQIYKTTIAAVPILAQCVIEVQVDATNGALYFYVNNFLVATHNITGFIKPANEYLYLGYTTASGTAQLLGYMKDVSLHDVALTDANRNWLAQGNKVPSIYSMVDFVQEQFDDDGIISANEKPAILSSWLSIYALNPASSALTTTSTTKDGDYSALVSEALSAGLTASTGQVVDYVAKTNAIRNYCFNSTTGVLLNMNVSTSVTAGSWDTLKSQYNTAKEALRTAITNQRITASSGLNPLSSNDYHQFPTDSDGTILSYEGSQNIIQVFEGVTELQATTGTPTAGQYAVAATPTYITAGTKSVSGKTMTFGVASAMSAVQDSAYITYTITGLTTNNTAFTVYLTQSFSKAQAGSDGSRFYILPSVSQVLKDKTGTLTPSTVSATRYAQIASSSPAVTTIGTLKYMLSTESSETTTSNGAAISIGSALWIEFYFYDATSTLLDRQRVNVITDGTDGTNGTDGQIISIVRSVSNVVKNKANVPSVSSVIFSFLSKSGESAAIAYSGYYKAYRRAKGSETFTLVTSGAGTSYTFAIGTDTYEEYKVELYTDSAYEDKTDEQSVLALFELGGNVKVDLNNQAITVPTDSAGDNGVFTGTPTTIRVYEGTTELTYDGVGTANGTWTIGTPTLSGCTGASITDSGTYATLNAITTMYADVATRTLPITGKTANGTSFTLSPVQSLTKNKQGVQGNAGVGIASTTIKYVASTSGTVIPSSGWQDTIPIVTAGQFLWTWTKIVYTDSVDHITDSYSVGMAGVTGNDGKGISSAIVEYAVNSSGTVEPETGWSPSVPTVTNGQYLWSRTVTTYTDSTASTVYSVSYKAIDASFYSVETSTSAINRDKLGVITNASVSFNAYRTVGNTRSSYTGYWTTQQSVDGSTWTNINNTSSASSSATIAKASISATAKWVRAIVYAEAGRTTLRDYEDIPIVTDGSENITIDVSNRIINIPVGLDNKPLSNGSFSSLVRVFRGTTELTVTTGFTIAVSSANGWTATKSGATVTITTSTATVITNLGFSLPITVTVGSKAYTENISLSATPKGLTGTGVASSLVQYVSSSSGTVIPSSGWSTTIPSVSAGQFLWTWTRISYTEGTPTDTYSVSMAGVTGNEGRGVESTVVTYKEGTSGTSAPTGDWLPNIPTVTAGKYLWTRTVITYTEAPLTSTSYSVSYQAVDGQNAIVMTSATAPSGTYVGQLGEYLGIMYRWSGTAWSRITAINWGLLTSAPSSGMIKDDTYTNSVTTITYKYSGSAWVAITQAVASITPKYLGAVTALPSSYTIGDFFVVETAFSTYEKGKIYYRSGSSWTLDEEYTSERYSKAMIDLLAIAAGTGDQILCSHIATNSAFIGSLKTISALFGDYVASASSENPAIGDKIIGMGKNIIEGIENPDEFAFLIAEKLGENNWMKHLWTKFLASGALSLVLTGCVQAPSLQSGLGNIWTQSSGLDTALVKGVLVKGSSNSLLITGNNSTNGKIFLTDTEYKSFQEITNPYTTSAPVGVYFGGKFIIFNRFTTVQQPYYTNETSIGWASFSSNFTLGVSEAFALSDKIVAVNSQGFSSSQTGISAWTALSNPFSGYSSVVGLGNTLYVTEATGRLKYSSDILNWTEITNPNTGVFFKLRKTNNIVFLLYNDGKIGYVENDTITVVETGLTSANVPQNIVFGNESYSICCSFGKVIITRDFSIFEEVYTGTTDSFFTVSYVDGLFYACTNTGYVVVYNEKETTKTGTYFVGNTTDLGTCDVGYYAISAINTGIPSSQRVYFYTSSYLEAGAGIISQQINTTNSVIRFSGGLCLQAGTHQWIGSVNAGGNVLRDVVFDEAFNTAPFAVLCTPSSSSSSVLISSTYNITAEQFSYLYGNRNSSAAITNGTMHWLALGVLS